jgi:DcmR-like sensory protein
MRRLWSEFLHGATPSAHAVQVYGDLEELAESVAAYLAAGFEAGEPAVVVATDEHWSRFEHRLAVAGWDAPTMRQHGLLAVEDADATLAAIMGGDRPSADAFVQVVGGLIDRVAGRSPGKTVRAFGEMVDVLCQRGETEAAIALEELWNDLARRRRFSLLCGYRLDVFDRSAQAGPLPEVCRVHSHVQPAYDPVRLSRAVGLALEEVLGPADAGKVYLLVGDDIRQDRVPVGQLVLMWVSSNMPVLADRILGAARFHYFDEPVVPASA